MDKREDKLVACAGLGFMAFLMSWFRRKGSVEHKDHSEAGIEEANTHIFGLDDSQYLFAESVLRGIAVLLLAYTLFTAVESYIEQRKTDATFLQTFKRNLLSKKSLVEIAFIVGLALGVVLVGLAVLFLLAVSIFLGMFIFKRK